MTAYRNQTHVDADFIDRCFTVRRDGCILVSSLHKNEFCGTYDEWDLLVSCVEDNITDSGAIDSVQAARDYETARKNHTNKIGTRGLNEMV